MTSQIFAGVDEVGRGCLAGPVVSVAIILNKSLILILCRYVIFESKNLHFPVSKLIKENLSRKYLL